MLTSDTIDKYFEYEEELHKLWNQYVAICGKLRERITHFQGFTSKMKADMDGRIVGYDKDGSHWVVFGQDHYLSGISNPGSDRRVTSRVTVKERDDVAG